MICLLLASCGTVWTAISVIVAIMGAITAVIAIIISIVHNRPKIEIKCCQYENPEFPKHVFAEYRGYAAAYCLLSVKNISNVPACIENCILFTTSDKYEALQVGEIKKHDLRLKLEDAKRKVFVEKESRLVAFPLIVQPYTALNALIEFTNFSLNSANRIKAKLKFEFVKQGSIEKDIYLTRCDVVEPLAADPKEHYRNQITAGLSKIADFIISSIDESDNS